MGGFFVVTTGMLSPGAVLASASTTPSSTLTGFSKIAIAGTRGTPAVAGNEVVTVIGGGAWMDGLCLVKLGAEDMNAARDAIVN